MTENFNQAMSGHYCGNIPHTFKFVLIIYNLQLYKFMAAIS